MDPKCFAVLLIDKFSFMCVSYSRIKKQKGKSLRTFDLRVVYELSEFLKMLKSSGLLIIKVHAQLRRVKV